MVCVFRHLKDLDNLNLTFLTTREEHAKEANSRVVAEALRDYFGLPVCVNDRNDLTLHNKKISGSAYKLGSKTAFHHCTLLVASDLDALGGTLRPTTSGISAKGIASVRSPVTNLNSHMPKDAPIVADELDAAIAAAFLKEFDVEDDGSGERVQNTNYAEGSRSDSSSAISSINDIGAAGAGSEPASAPSPTSAAGSVTNILDIATDGWAGVNGELAARRKEVQSWSWLFGQGPAFSFEQAKAFEWGQATVRLRMKRGQ